MTVVRRTATRKKTTAKKGRWSKRGAKSSARKSAGRKKAPRITKVKSPIERLEEQLPPTLAHFSRRVRARLTQLEGQIEKAEARYRRGWTKLLRDGSHQLGLFEARGERQWSKLTLQARRDVVKLLQRLEKALQPPDSDSAIPSEKAARKKAARKKAARKKAARTKVEAERPTPRGRAPAEQRGAPTGEGEERFEEVLASRSSQIEEGQEPEELDDAFPGESAEDEGEPRDELLKRGF